jgi:hypothetical protein
MLASEDMAGGATERKFHWWDLRFRRIGGHHPPKVNVATHPGESILMITVKQVVAEDAKLYS